MDICIIGAGLGGLTSGALLAKSGYNVTVLEQHYVVGGSATAFKRKGYTCEVGLHEMDGLYTDGAKKRIFESLGVYDNVEFVRVPEFFRTKTDTLDFVMPENEEEAISELVKKYPEEEAGIKKYFKLMADVTSEFGGVRRMKWWQGLFFPFLYPNIFKYKNKSVREVMDEIFNNEELKLLLNSNIGYYHDFVDSFSFLYHSLGQHSYFTGGGWFIKGGSQVLSNYLAKVIVDNGGTVITKANVNSIDEKDGKKIVSYSHKKTDKEVVADIVISNASPMQTYKMAGVEYENKYEVASSLITVYLGFKANLKEVYGKRPYSNFYFGDVKDIDSYHDTLAKDIKDRGFVFVDYSQIDSGLTPADKTFGIFCTNDYLRDWENLSDQEYADKKKEVADSYLARLEEDYPNIKDHLEFVEVGTAKTMKRYLRTENGTAYGFAPTANQFFRKTEVKSKKVNNLYFTGAWLIGGGFSPAISSGGLCFKTIVKDHPLSK